jgi:hypothetical protein
MGLYGRRLQILRIFGVGGLSRNCGRACRNSTKSLSRFQASSQGQNGASEIIREGSFLHNDSIPANQPHTSTPLPYNPG